MPCTRYSVASASSTGVSFRRSSTLIASPFRPSVRHQGIRQRGPRNLDATLVCFVQEILVLLLGFIELARHAQEGWDLANKRTSELGHVKGRLMKIVQAFKRGTPASHVFCECKKCAALYEAVREVNPYEMPHGRSEVHGR